MEQAVLPLQTYLFGALFLLVAIALESRVLYRRLHISRQTSVEYATAINLIAASAGWLIFFLIQDYIPLPIKDQIVSYIFFDRLLAFQAENFTLLLAATGVVIFFLVFLIKLKALELLETLANDQPAQAAPLQASPRRYHPSLSDRLGESTRPSLPNQATTMLLANAYSYSAISLLLFLRFLQIHTLR
jgi:hypothetical protein